jgi:hypothetical protein
MAIAASAALRVPLSRDVAFHLKSAVKSQSVRFEHDEVEGVLEWANGLGGAELARFIAACGAHGLLPLMFSPEVGLPEVKALAAESSPEARLATMNSWRSQL